MNNYQRWAMALSLAGGLAYGEGATSRVKLDLEVKTRDRGKTFTIEFTGDDQANCLFLPKAVSLAAPIASGQIGIPTPPMGNISFDTLSGPCKKFPAPSQGEITFVIGDLLPSVTAGYYMLAIDGQRADKIVLLDRLGKPSLIDPSDIPQ